jgi:signal peptide peptidase SppA
MPMKHQVMVWLGTDAGYLSYAEKITARDENTVDPKAFGGWEEDEKVKQEAEFGEMDYMMQMIDTTAVVSISGPMDNDYSYMNRYFGITSYPEIRSAVAEAINHPDVSAILLDIDSPGGAVEGLSEVSDFIRDADRNHKPVYTNSSSKMTSGGYWLGSNGRTITTAELASVGSIGVIAVHREMSKMMKDIGVTATVLRKGKYKALANPYEPLTEDAKAEIQGELDTIYDVFTRTVAENRGQTQQFIQDNAAEGRVFFGREAREVGLVDTLGTFDDALAMVKKKTEVTAGQGNDNSLEVSDMPRKKKVITEKDQAVLAAGGELAPAASDSEKLDLEGSESASSASDVTDPPAEGGAEGAAPAASASADADGEGSQDAAGSEGKVTSAGSEAGGNESASAESLVIASLTTQLAAAQDAAVDLKVSIKTLEAAAETSSASVTALKSIAVAATQRLQVATGSMATDLDGVEVSALVAQYETLNNAFLERFPVGASAKIPMENDAPAAGPSPMDTARSNATRIN